MRLWWKQLTAAFFLWTLLPGAELLFYLSNCWTGGVVRWRCFARTPWLLDWHSTYYSLFCRVPGYYSSRKVPAQTEADVILREQRGGAEVWHTYQRPRWVHASC